MTDDLPATALRNLRFGWWGLLVFLMLGVLLETMHGLKVGWYLDVSNQTRRLMWTLSHAHGTLISLINIAFGLLAARLSSRQPRRMKIASGCFIGTAILLPGGFFLGGCFIYSGDPGLGVLLVPPGALLLAIGVLLTALALTSWSKAGADESLRG